MNRTRPRVALACVLALATLAASPLPGGFLDVKLGSTLEEVKRSLVQGSQIYEVNDVKSCPTAPAQPCKQLIEQVPKGNPAPHKKATYVFSPFNGHLTRVVVDYRIDYLDVARGFRAEWGPPTEEREVEVPAQAFFPKGTEYTRIWRDDEVEILLVHRVFPTSPNQSTEGRVEFVSRSEAVLEDEMARRLKKLEEPAPDEPPAKLF